MGTFVKKVKGLLKKTPYRLSRPEVGGPKPLPLREPWVGSRGNVPTAELNTIRLVLWFSFFLPYTKLHKKTQTWPTNRPDMLLLKTHLNRVVQARVFQSSIKLIQVKEFFLSTFWPTNRTVATTDQPEGLSRLKTCRGRRILSQSDADGTNVLTYPGLT